MILAKEASLHNSQRLINSQNLHDILNKHTSHGILREKGASSMITERLRVAVAKAEQLPEQAQDALAAEIERAINDARWDVLLSDTRFDEAIEALIAQTEQEEPLPFPKPRGEE